jgi:hypothetical protein
VPINYESSVGAYLLCLTITLPYYYYPFAYCLFLHLLSTNHKCTQPCYFPLLYKIPPQKVKMDWISSTISSRLGVAPIAVPVVLFDFARVMLVFRDIIYAIIILYS